MTGSVIQALMLEGHHYSVPDVVTSCHETGHKHPCKTEEPCPWETFFPGCWGEGGGVQGGRLLGRSGEVTVAHLC